MCLDRRPITPAPIIQPFFQERKVNGAVQLYYTRIIVAWITIIFVGLLLSCDVYSSSIGTAFFKTDNILLYYPIIPNRERAIRLRVERLLVYYYIVHQAYRYLLYERVGT